MENNCIIVKRKDYDELVAKANESKSDKIDVSWSFNHHYRGITLNDNGTINLDGKLYNQVTRICQRLRNEFNGLLTEYKISIKNELRLEFSKLSLWDRIFFKY